MTDTELRTLGAVIAALGGAAIGVERERSGHARGPGARFAGVRTFTLRGGLAGLSGWLWAEGAPWLAAVLVVAFIVTLILLIFVIPQFESLFKGFGADLPAFTRMVIDLSMFVQTKGWAVGIVVGGGIAFYLYTKKRSKKLREFEDRLFLKLPIVGSILVKASIARFARTLSTMFSAGVPLVEALQSVAGATGNIVYEKAVLAMRDEVSTGQRLQRAMENTGLFPNMVIQMIAVGEESGSLDEMSSKVADFYEADVDNAVDSMSSLLEPMIMAILGVLVGGLVIAMYLPIFKMGAVI